MATYVINKGYSSGSVQERRVDADSFATVGEFVDFKDAQGTVLRILAKSIVTVERVEMQ